MGMGHWIWGIFVGMILATKPLLAADSPDPSPDAQPATPCEAPPRVHVPLDPLEGLSFDLPVVVNEAVRTYLERFQTLERSSFLRHLARARYYVPLIQNILQEEGLPRDLAYLPLVESGFNPYAYSRSQAGGLWQFIPSTGKK